LRLAQWASWSPVPVYALGGVNAETARRLIAIPLAGFAAIEALTPPLQTASKRL
jgi:thiamine monophosphate synthase